ncbi:bifunctional 2-polyprenyl-6-hydroxyphenol methylase/3-demethylubiquinol 3-O-methyltransferase UbiG [Xanthobacteraceae bacterium Astr-EGSB]|uniref:bifunctional 2-polyprenyl-6-hydroxyphenol methylase/3-demethylubiquinol 3-O-methyltransferase UbiG n=1 Tax=Astrobacterium formosum TaxID=3069710 RepID=UPI0027B7E4D2|nr:bifunctional 2-polyprenyl-6-hydroxyphenol methylase/3-demethylubiquinol 3-O-methyltransferase UbiG [Xanthobacteraceae bacterium Astr-EGSB]
MNQFTQADVSTIDKATIARFDVPMADWWDSTGPARWLHKYNPARVSFICRAAGQTQRRTGQADDLRGLRIVDIGCGGGVLCEPLAMLGATVVGVDPAPLAIEAARLHALASDLDIDYRCTTAEAMAAAGERFDVVLAMEVIEHVADCDAFLRRCAELVRPRGLLILSTINRTAKSFAYAIVMAEYVLRVLPKGTHDWRKFRRPVELERALAPSGFRVVDVSGVTMRLSTRELRLSKDVGVNFLMALQRAE